MLLNSGPPNQVIGPLSIHLLRPSYILVRNHVFSTTYIISLFDNFGHHISCPPVPAVHVVPRGRKYNRLSSSIWYLQDTRLCKNAQWVSPLALVKDISKQVFGSVSSHECWLVRLNVLTMPNYKPGSQCRPIEEVEQLKYSKTVYICPQYRHQTPVNHADVVTMISPWQRLYVRYIVVLE